MPPVLPQAAPPPFVVNCRAAYVGSVARLSMGFLSPILTSIASRFSASSNGAIDLRFTQANALPGAGGSAVQSAHLHAALSGIAPNLRGPVNRIGLLFAGTYARAPGLLGVMFDRGFVTNDDPNSNYTSIPREGCAVFLDAIADLRAPGMLNPEASQDFAKELEYTAMHELGHVFNLGHRENAPNFMRSSSADGVYAQGWFFDGSHQTMLSACSSSPYIQPGGSEWGNLGPEVSQQAGGTYNQVRGASKMAANLKLTIRVTPSEFHYYQPVELDISLHLAGESRSFARVPDRLDPGYAEFAIWIEDPDGEVRRYRAINHYCAAPKFRIIRSGEPFRRDVSLFGQSGGYTFTKAGRHKIWAEFHPSASRKVRSNVLKIDLKDSLKPTSAEAIHQQRLIAAAPILFYRNHSGDKVSMEALLEVSRSKRHPVDRAAASYSLGRLQAAAAKASAGAEAKRQWDRARRNLSAAVYSDCLGSNRKRKSLEILGQATPDEDGEVQP